MRAIIELKYTVTS